MSERGVLDARLSSIASWFSGVDKVAPPQRKAALRCRTPRRRPSKRQTPSTSGVERSRWREVGVEPTRPMYSQRHSTAFLLMNPLAPSSNKTDKEMPRRFVCSSQLSYTFLSERDGTRTRNLTITCSPDGIRCLLLAFDPRPPPTAAR